MSKKSIPFTTNNFIKIPYINEYDKQDEFEAQTTPVTQLQWYNVMGSTPSFFKKIEDCPKSYMRIGNDELCPNNPVESIHYLSSDEDDVAIFIRKLNEMDKAYHYGLPHEEEWDFIARGGLGNATKYFFGEVPESLDGHSWYSTNSREQTHEVGQKKPNRLGLYDMPGNVREVVAFENNFEILVAGKATGLSTSIPFMGCSWKDNANKCMQLKATKLPALQYKNKTEAVNSNISVETRDSTWGFRLIRVKKQ